MALKVHSNGFVEIKSQKDAKEALEAFHNLKEEIDELKKESGLDDLEKDAMAYKAALQNFMTEKDMEHLDGDGYHATLVKSAGSSRWITTDDDLVEGDTGTSLQSLVEAKFGESIKKKGPARSLWLKITRRIADPEAIDEAVNEKLLDVDEISPAWVETTRKPYVRVFDD